MKFHRDRYLTDREIAAQERMAKQEAEAIAYQLLKAIAKIIKKRSHKQSNINAAIARLRLY
jgi:pyrroline-5-carboxylate reductase